ncbi:vacuolar protein sorting-associated protein 13-like [Xenia sp. Carnegie-2017]|uniref:vacuolar protein sorting-associated protein 13-like n=1 Tax=Xenia sp. Carnegie-2017 TaxID=2897299 RepID=UPI001F036E05|nr:vacuolar protein sorting-associated protein 13-like [Xenia sp. Carnegie-2017]
MVFESHVVSILNNVLGQYVENLDSSQFVMSIWGGDVRLENLIFKENALDVLNLPLKIVRGHLGKLVLKIPWKNLYSEPVIARVDEVYILARPNSYMKYDAEKEEKLVEERKQNELTAIEDAIRYAEEAKKKTKDDHEKNLNFTEKLALHIVKNIQVCIPLFVCILLIIINYYYYIFYLREKLFIPRRVSSSIIHISFLKHENLM